MKKELVFTMVCLLGILVAAPVRAADAQATTAPKEGEAQGESPLSSQSSSRAPFSATDAVR